MEFHNYPPAWKEYATARKIKSSPQECVAQLLKFLPPDKRNIWNTRIQLMAELEWQKNKKPYYDLYPGIAEAFAKIDLSKIKCDHLKLPLPQLLIRLPVGHEVKGQHRKIRSILVIESRSQEYGCPGFLLSIHDGTECEILGKNVCIHTVSGISLIPDTYIADRLEAGRLQPYSEDILDNEEIDVATRIVVAICLLKDDDFLIEPLPLASDIDKWNNTHDLSLIAKAERRGKRGWAVGKQIELSPHFRRPHFAIRWCGQGKTDPRIRPIKGCLVLREKAKEIPTGYLSEEE